MKTRSHGIVAVMMLSTVVAVVISGQAGAAMIYQDDFAGSAGTDLDGTAPGIRPGSETWKADAAYQADGAVTAGGRSDCSARLPFTPAAGNVYTLEVDFEVGSGDSEYWISVGYANGSNLSRRFVQTGVDGYGTFRRLEVLTCDTHTGTGAGGSMYHDELTAPGRVLVWIVLNATDVNVSNWTTAWTAKDAEGNTFSREATLAAEGSYGDINYIGFSRRAAMTGTIHNLKLSAVTPEPATMALLGAFVLLKVNFGSTEADCSRGDFDSDHDVDLDDFVILKTNFGASEND